MSGNNLGIMEERFADIIWNHAPISSSDLMKMSEQELGWKKSTVYTVLRRFSEKGIFVNEKGIVNPVLSREEFKTIQAERIVKERFHSSLPSFIAAFTSRNKLTEEELLSIRKIIDSCGKKN